MLRRAQRGAVVLFDDPCSRQAPFYIPKKQKGEKQYVVKRRRPQR